MQKEEIRIECLKIVSLRPNPNYDGMIAAAKVLEAYVTSPPSEPTEATPKKVAKQGKSGNPDLLG